VNLKTVAEFAKTSPFTAGQLRFWIFNAENNGMAKAGAVVRVGRRVYLDVDGVERWIAAQNPSREVPRG
jgi:hypothetical protein